MGATWEPYHRNHPFWAPSLSFVSSFCQQLHRAFSHFLFIFPVQLTASRIGHHTRLIHTLLKVLNKYRGRFWGRHPILELKSSSFFFLPHLSVVPLSASSNPWHVEIFLLCFMVQCARTVSRHGLIDLPPHRRTDKQTYGKKTFPSRGLIQRTDTVRGSPTRPDFLPCNVIFLTILFYSPVVLG